MNEDRHDAISVPEFARIVGIAATTVTRYIERGFLTPLTLQTYPNGIRRYTLSRTLAEYIKDHGKEGWEYAKQNSTSTSEGATSGV